LFTQLFNTGPHHHHNHHPKRRDVKLGFGGSSKQQADQFPYYSSWNKKKKNKK
jgi:hypothetical protein